MEESNNKKLGCFWEIVFSKLLQDHQTYNQQTVLVALQKEVKNTRIHMMLSSTQRLGTCPEKESKNHGCQSQRLAKTAYWAAGFL